MCGVVLWLALYSEMVHNLCREGLIVDVLEGGLRRSGKGVIVGSPAVVAGSVALHSLTHVVCSLSQTAEYQIMLVRAPPQVVERTVRKIEQRMWLLHGRLGATHLGPTAQHSFVCVH